jgi:hypothetical protein
VSSVDALAAEMLEIQHEPFDAGMCHP